MHKIKTGLIQLTAILLAVGSSIINAEQLQEEVQYQDLGDISQTASDYIIQQMPAEFTIESLETAKIDSRIKFKQCQQPLTASISGGFKVSHRYTVGVKCANPRWSFFVPVKARISRDIVVANSTILRGDYISANKLKVIKQKLNGQHQRYFMKKESIIGKEAKRNIKMGTPITDNLLSTRYLVKRKQEVIIEAKNSRLMVKMKGIALKNGKNNDRIKVRNINSNKIIEGVVSAEGVVTVNF